MIKDPEKRKKYHREWRQKRRDAFFTDKFCEKCGATDKLELDHINPKKKRDHKIWSWSLARREEEIKKCRILCEKCHRNRHAKEWRKPLVHGTSNGYYRKKCRCVKCLAYRNEEKKEYRRRGGAH